MVVAIEELGKADQSVATTLQAHLHYRLFAVPSLRDGRTEAQMACATGARGTAWRVWIDGTPSGLGRRQYPDDFLSRWRPVGGQRDKVFYLKRRHALSYGLVALTTSGKTEDGEKAIQRDHYSPRNPRLHDRPTPYKKIGWHRVDTREQIFDNVRVPARDLLGEEGSGFRAFLKTLECGRISVATLGLSLAEACLEMSLKYALERKTFGKPLGFAPGDPVQARGYGDPGGDGEIHGLSCGLAA